MKKLFFTAILALGLSSISLGQEKGDVEFGVNVGLNSSSITDGYFAANSRTGFNIGFAADYFFSDRWSIKGKFIYDQKGWNDSFYKDKLGNIYKTDVALNYLTIPVMANWHFGKKRNWYLNFGPYVGFILNANETATDFDIKENFNTTDAGLALGIGVKIPVSNKLKISLEYEEQAGIIDLFKDNTTQNILTARRSFNVGLNFMMK